MSAAVDFCVCSYEDRPEAMDSVILMGESLCKADPGLRLHLTLPDAPPSVQSWAKRWPGVSISTVPPQGVTGWDVKPTLMLRELDAGVPAVVWLDTDMIVTRSLSTMLAEFPYEALIVAEEWNRQGEVRVCEFWGLTSVRPLRVINACVVRANQAHRTLLERWLCLINHPRYRHAQTMPFEQRLLPVATDGWLLAALLESEDFAHVEVECLRIGRHIAQCAGSSGYRPHHRLLDLFRGLPVLIHGLGRKPWTTRTETSRLQRFLLDLATDVSPYVLASRRVARDLNVRSDWLESRTSLGALLRALTASHPGMAGFPLALLHAIHLQTQKAIGFNN
jgi:hypothetical protein